MIKRIINIINNKSQKVKKHALTLAEILLTFFIIGVVATAVISNSVARVNETANSLMTYSVFSALKTAVAEYSITNSITDWSTLTTTQICEALKSIINTTGQANCNNTVDDATGIAEKTPALIFANGVRVYIRKNDYPTGYRLLYVDIDGPRRKGTWDDDLIGININKSGIVLPRYDSVAATSVSYLSASYGYFSGTTFVNVQKNVSYKVAVCKSGTIADATYCSGNPIHATCTSNDCEVILNKPLSLR